MGRQKDWTEWQHAHNFAILCCSQILGLYHIFKGFISNQ